MRQVHIFILLGILIFSTFIFPSSYAATLAEKLSFLPPAWSNKLPSEERFVLVLDDEAVLDKETGLVWELSPGETRMTWNLAQEYCYKKVVGGRLGWRLPTVEELASLVDPTQSDPALPSNHPFIGVLDYYYTMTTTPNIYYAYAVGFVGTSPGVSVPPGKTIELNVWCVRGGHGYDFGPSP